MGSADLRRKPQKIAGTVHTHRKPQEPTQRMKERPAPQKHSPKQKHSLRKQFQNLLYKLSSLVPAKRAEKRQKLSGPVLRDTARLSQRYPPIARYGVFGVSTWPIACDTPSPFSQRFPLGQHAKWRCDTPPQKGYLSGTRAIPFENKANGCDTPLCDTISKGYCAIWGGISHWAEKRQKSLRKLLVQTVFIWVGGFLGGLAPLQTTVTIVVCPLGLRFVPLSAGLSTYSQSLGPKQRRWLAD